MWDIHATLRRSRWWNQVRDLRNVITAITQIMATAQVHAITIKPGKWTCLLPHLLLLWRISRDFFWFFYFQICKHKLCISSRLFICFSVIIFYLNALESLTSNYICLIAFISISFWTLFKAYWFLVMDNRLRLGLS